MFGNILTECRIFKDPSDDLGGGINNIISSGFGVVVVYLCGNFFLFLFLGLGGFAHKYPHIIPSSQTWKWIL